MANMKIRIPQDERICSSFSIYFFVTPLKEIFIELLSSAVCSQYILQTVWPLFISHTVVS